MSDPASRPSPWEILKFKFANPNLLTDLLRCSGINRILDSQASFSQLLEADVKLIGLVLHPPESSMMKDALIKKIAEQEQSDYINYGRLQQMATGDMYFTLVKQELDNLKQHLSLNGRQVSVIKNIAEFKNEPDVLYAILLVEGAHAFFGPKSGEAEDVVWNSYWSNFEQFTNENRILSLNITHLQDNEFCCHAFGMQVFKQQPFCPSGNGISEKGKELLQRMETKKILLDIKHMSLQSRQQLYQMRMGNYPLPIICTHAGLTGIDSGKRGRYFRVSPKIQDGFGYVEHLKPAGYLGGTAFNPSSINLYDDDVVEIVSSRGLIGLSVDQRILGFPTDYMIQEDYAEDIYDEEYISPKEFDFFKRSDRSGLNDDDYLTFADITKDDRQNFEIYHARFYLNTVFHFFVIARRYNIEPALMAQSICIGSDFDGLINPIDCCLDVTGHEKFKIFLLRNFSDWEHEFSERTGMKISSSVSPQVLLDNLFYNNAVNFLQKHFA